MINGRARLYIDITNSCNLKCPFCCANSSPTNTRFMSIDLFKSIINNDEHSELEIQIEGGEPSINKDLWNMIKFCDSNERIKKVTILHNCTKINDFITFFKNETFTKVIELKLSLNFHLLKLFPDLVSRIENAHIQLKDTKFVRVHVNARYREDNTEDDEMIKAMYMTSVPTSRIFVCDFCNYGRATEFEKPCSEWLGYASDGKFFGSDTDGRFKYEKTLA